LFLWKNQAKGLEKGKNIDKKDNGGVKTMKTTLGLATRNPGKKVVEKSK